MVLRLYRSVLGLEQFEKKVNLRRTRFKIGFQFGFAKIFVGIQKASATIELNRRAKAAHAESSLIRMII